MRLVRNDKYYFTRDSKFSIQQHFLFELASQLSEIESRVNCEKISDKKIMEIFEELPYEEALNGFVNKCSIEKHKEFPGHHISWWNYNKTKRMLLETGFSKVYLSGYGQSNFFEMRNTTLFDNTYPQISLYIEEH